MIRDGMSSSEKVDAESVLTNFRPDERGPTPPLPAFKYETDLAYFKCNIADEGSSFVSVTFTQVKLLCLAHDPRLRIVSVSLRVIVPDNEVKVGGTEELVSRRGRGPRAQNRHGEYGENRRTHTWYGSR